MSEKKKAKVLLSQLEDALEERDSDRRKAKKPIPENVPQDRRKTDRRTTTKQVH